MARRHLRLTAVVALVLVSLTGFSRGGHGSHGSHGSRGYHGSSSRHGGGGGCSSSHARHSSGTDSGSGSGAAYGSSGSSGSSSSYGSSAGSRGLGSTHSASPGRAARPEAKIVQCISDDARHEAATVRVTNRRTARATYSVTVDFRDPQGASVSLGSARITLGGGATGTVRVSPATASSDLASCRLRSVG
ncbi:hypothetical protein AB0I49_05450 [Streptomyces sp. NPDC050617]|uniref:hypothetical protein n=1 Tax=Streptomyces sp. NPDC050617 TaxID=3154628 RepID=UPI003422121F